jgi:hypothetical protein
MAGKSWWVGVVAALVACGDERARPDDKLADSGEWTASV